MKNRENTTGNRKLELTITFAKELAAAKLTYQQNYLNRSFAHLERAHILGQRYFFRHWRTHWWMLKVGLKRGDWHEVVGQCVRLAAVIPGFVSGWVPKGNTGGANVSPIKPMPIPPDLESLLSDYHVLRDVLWRGGVYLLLALLLWYLTSSATV
ncbi:uncharacterized protein DUF3703 [Arenicella xantha]|uniref:Uncharacterized protein DUF3703 n=2 Tax=Arenicella xantha TaxID=644221 RepID=A0A395JT42_9GAMM|nr:uncharacterized protein DUF3703 [Arenicella xantha]